MGVCYTDDCVQVRVWVKECVCVLMGQHVRVAVSAQHEDVHALVREIGRGIVCADQHAPPDP